MALLTLSHPCLFDVIRDPGETTNLAAGPAHAGMLATMRAQLATYKPYLPVLTRDNLACYNCTKQVTEAWKGFAGPCCISL